MTDIARGLPLPAQASPPRSVGALGWLRANLFNSVLNSILTLLCLALLLVVIPPFVRWALIDAVWHAPSGAACHGGGACWAFIGEKFRFIVFGRYPVDQDWRPTAVLIIFLLMILAACDRRLWGRGRAIHPVARIVLAILFLLVGWLWAEFVAVWLQRLADDLGHGLVFAVVGRIARLAFAVPVAAGLTYLCAALWGRWLAILWSFGLIAAVVLMRGGVFHLSYVETELWSGLPLTLIIAVLGMVIGFPLAILLALGRRSRLPAVRAICVGYIELVRGVPLITVLFMASLMLPLFLPTGVTIDKLLRAQIAFILFAAAYLAEVIRGGLQAIPRGQIEAADAIGLSYWQRTRLIVLPQALSLVIPPLVNTFIGIFKDTTLVIIISLFDLLGTAEAALADPLWPGFYIEDYVVIAAIYFCFCFFMSRYSLMLERVFNRGRSR